MAASISLRLLENRGFMESFQDSYDDRSWSEYRVTEAGERWVCKIKSYLTCTATSPRNPFAKARRRLTDDEDIPF